ncbi:MAG: cysteine-rich CWC family protein [Betaproteobacteria bacterium]|nr:cysteine-rich CWC family protein [Betaproteobacteria bacterium]
MSTPAAIAGPTGTCARCGAPFRCGMEAGDAECWCAGMPPLLPVPAASAAVGCLCPACLQARLEQARQERALP